MADFIREYQVVLLLALFAGVLYWAFDPKRCRRRRDGSAGQGDGAQRDRDR